MVKIIMHGCNGAMGQVITKLAAEDKDAEITAVTIAKSKLLGHYHMMMGQNPVYVIAFGGISGQNDI